MTHNTTVSAAKYIDVRDKEQLYVIIQNEKGKQVINVGLKTYEAVKKLTEEEQEKITQEMKIPILTKEEAQQVDEIDKQIENINNENQILEKQEPIRGHRNRRNNNK